LKRSVPPLSHAASVHTRRGGDADAREPGSLVLIEAIMSTIDDYAEREMDTANILAKAAQRWMQTHMRRAALSHP
jgi:hypothetical protein